MALDTDLAAARTAYFSNADYEEAQSVTKAAAFITACRKLLAVPVTRTANGARDGNELELDPAEIRNQQADARAWLRGQRAAEGENVIHADFTGFRE